MSYTPSTDFDFTGLTGYAPSVHFDFSGGTAQPYDLSMNHEWSLTAPGVQVGALNQIWALDGVSIDDMALNQDWALLIYDYQDVALDQQWPLATPTFRNIGFEQSWVLAAPIFRNSALDHQWLLATPTFADASLNQTWALTVPTFADAFLVQDWEMVAPQGSDIGLAQQWRLEASAVWTKVVSKTAYLFALEQHSEGRAEIPISNFSGQFRSGDPSYLQATIPNATAWADTLAVYAAHDDTEMVINAGYQWSDGSYTTQEIARVTLRNARYDYGARNATISLDGIDTRTNPAPAAHVLTGASYRSIAASGLVRYRVAPDFNVRPGDTVTVGDDTFVVGELSYQVGDSQANMEVAEATAPIL